MSPEQARGETVDHRTDLYSLGLLLFELIVGMRFFRAKTQAKLFRIVACAKQPNLGEVTSAELAQVIERLLAPVPSERYSSAEQALVELTSAWMATGTQGPTELGRLVRGVSDELASAATPLASVGVTAPTDIQSRDGQTAIQPFRFMGPRSDTPIVGSERNAPTETSNRAVTDEQIQAALGGGFPDTMVSDGSTEALTSGGRAGQTERQVISGDPNAPTKTSNLAVTDDDIEAAPTVERDSVRDSMIPAVFEKKGTSKPRRSRVLVMVVVILAIVAVLALGVAASMFIWILRSSPTGAVSSFQRMSPVEVAYASAGSMTSNTIVPISSIHNSWSPSMTIESVVGIGHSTETTCSSERSV